MTPTARVVCAARLRGFWLILFYFKAINDDLNHTFTQPPLFLSGLRGAVYRGVSDALRARGTGGVLTSDLWLAPSELAAPWARLAMNWS